MAARAKNRKIATHRTRVWTGKPTVVIAQATVDDKCDLLDGALDKSGFWQHLEQARRRADVSSHSFRILIKPDLELFNLGDATGTDPVLVEHVMAVVDYMEPLAHIIHQTLPEPNGLRWRYLDSSVLFEFSHLTPVPFERFVARVDIAKAVQSMNDYIGGACVPVARNRAGRVVYQAERNIYLPQPNWITLFGGEFIDVGKLEYIEYKKRQQRIFWRTIKSSNGSAEFDDGIVTFAFENPNQTRVTIVARQKFKLPLFWQVVNIDLAPKVKDFLVVDAYTRYFRQTIANFEAQYQGRDFRIGRPWNPAQGEADVGSDQRLEAIVEMLGRVGTALANFGDLGFRLGTLFVKS